MRYEVTTATDAVAAQIVQTVDVLDIDNVRTQIVRQVISTLEPAIHSALMKLGWTPPRTIDRRADPVKLYRKSADFRVRALERRGALQSSQQPSYGRR